MDGIAERVVDNIGDVNDRVYYMPHQAVIRESSMSTRLRVVFDASSHDKYSKSLNDNLESGPNMTADLVGLLLRFRGHRITLVADIEKAFLQIQIRESDRDALRFLWLGTAPDDGGLPLIETWRMTRVPFGTTSSPFLLAATVRHHLRDVKPEYAATAKLLEEGFYVDDLLTGAADEEGARKIYTESKAVFKTASMNLHKWASNSEDMRQLFEKNDSLGPKNLGYVSGILKVLGLSWDPITDRLTFVVSDLAANAQEKDTKRFLLKTTASLYDPLGWIAPFIVRAKIMFQRLWKLNLEWDDVIPEDIKVEWTRWCSELSELHKIQVPRFYGGNVNEETSEIRLHIFADASPLAYGAVAYICVTDNQGHTTSSIMMSKSRIAPVKVLTLARLELMACLLAARLCSYLRQGFQQITEVHLWTDSTIALYWIKGEATRWQQFVQNRVTEIQRRTEVLSWRHCPGKENPADLMTRGITASQLTMSSLWWSGTPWMCMPEVCWPHTIPTDEFSEKELEQKKRAEVVQSTTSVQIPTVLDIECYSSANRLFRVTAWILRFVHKLQHKSDATGPLDTTELEQAERYWILRVQQDSFVGELVCHQKGTKLPCDSPLRDIALSIDDEGILRVAGRLQFSQGSYDEQHPIVLPRQHHLSGLLIRPCHLQVLHGGVRDTLVQLREKYWVVRARQQVKKMVKECVTCQRFNARPATEETAPLPRDRVERALPFEVTGIDFAGPLLVNDRGTVRKSYITLFTCGVTRAVHLELVGDLSGRSFLLAFRRFLSRRGVPQVIYSDNALTFKKANKELKNLWSVIRNEEVLNYFSDTRIQWKFIVERAPWWGGFYERLVGATKLALKKSLGTKCLEVDQLITNLTEIEAVLNSRPLTHVYQEPGEPGPLCPSYFLTGKRLTSLPGLSRHEISHLDDSNFRRLWSDRQKVLDNFWRRWTKEYLTELRVVNNSKCGGKQVEEGDVVLLRESMQPRQLWKMG